MEKRKIGVDGRQDRNRKKDEWRKNGKREGDMKGVGFMKENEVKVAKNDENEKKTRSFYEKKGKTGRARAVVCGWKTLETVFIVAKVMSHSEY